MLPEVQTYFDLQNDTGRVYYNARVLDEQNYPEPEWRDDMTPEERAAYYEADTAHILAQAKTAHERKEQIAAAWAALTSHSDPLVVWLTTDREINRSYQGHRNLVLRALPMDLDTLERFGGRQGWCGEYGELLARARRAGVLPKAVPDLADIGPLTNAIRRHTGFEEYDLTRIVRMHLPALLESARQTAAELEMANDTEPDTDTETEIPAEPATV